MRLKCINIYEVLRKPLVLINKSTYLFAIIITIIKFEEPKLRLGQI